MVKLVIGDKVDSTPVLTLRLTEQPLFGGVTLQALDRSGKPWNIVTLLESGILKLHRNVPDSIGLQTDRGSGTIEVTRNEDCG